MKSKNREVRLYNVLFPLWMLMMLPALWLVIIPGNFVIDSLVLIIALTVLKVGNKKQWYRKYILKICGFGMLADLFGAGFMLLMMTVWGLGSMGDEIYLTIPGLVIAAALIFVFNYSVTFRKIDRGLRLKLSLTFALVTAPYTFLIPSSWIYG